MDRRTFMITGACLPGVAASAWPWLAHAAACGNTVAVADSTLAGGAALAGYAAHRQWPVFETGDDIGALWYSTLAPLLGVSSARASATLIGLTRASDYFVLSELAARAGHLIEHRYEQGAGAGAQPAHVAFAFAPRVAR
ncbi:hypothetical protein [Paraburkholderia aromaticivorans]|uniref:Uncharacterized protein n=1 Tax=Paraburkholderia aromaticivorans TaxID=2026199 RepID=A0A248VKY2_9BURK|nr:hypothetical protein [Paraburkholderia aromaticivorans]ASV99648.1 hypothetical protein CJU94_16770 [Paraburkholderia aromaticivorans]